MTDDLAGLQAQTVARIGAAGDLAGLDAVRVAVLGKSGSLSALMKGLGAIPAEERRARGAALNAAREAIEAALSGRRATLGDAALDARLLSERIDISLPPRPEPPAAPHPGLVHPISRTIEEIVAIFGAMGLTVAEGPDVEDDWRNFGALNIPEHHPARQDHDTFYLPGKTQDGRDKVLRTHTSPGQIRTMMAGPPPYRVIVPGRTYRSDHDATHSPMFHQVEGLAIDRALTLGHLKGCLVDFLRAFFGIPSLPVRFRASYFPFTEPSMEVDIGWNRRTGELGRGDGWLEILGSGMVHPNVLLNCDVNPDEWQGFAFGMGIERVAMLKLGLTDLRPFYDSDLRWLRATGFRPDDVATLGSGVA